MPATEIPRERIPWVPTVDYALCAGDQECFRFCKNQVFEWDEDNRQPRVTKPYNCVVGCQACIHVCPTGAITFPSKQVLRETLRRLRSQLAAPATTE